MPTGEREEVGLKVRERSRRAVAGTFRKIYREIGAPVDGRISVEHIQRDFSTLVEDLADQDVLRDVNMALVSCFGMVAHPSGDREDLVNRLNPIVQLQNDFQEKHQSKSAALQLVINTVKTLSHRPGGDSIMKAQVAFLALAQTLGEFGVTLPQPVELSEVLLNKLIQANDEETREKVGRYGKQIPGAQEIHSQLKITDQVYPIEASPMTGVFAHVAADKKAIEVAVPTAALSGTDGVSETGSLAYRLYFVTQRPDKQWGAATINEPIRTTAFDPGVHHITQTLGFWPDLPNERVRYGLVVEQIGNWGVTQEKQAGKEKISTSFADQADEEKFLQALDSLYGRERLFYESTLDSEALVPFSDKLGQVLADLKEKGYEELLKAPMKTVGQFRTDVTNFRLAFCGRVGDQHNPGNLIPLGLNINSRAGVAGELMYTPDSVAEMEALKYADIADRRLILTAIGAEGSENSFEFFIHASTHVSEGSARGLDGRVNTEQYTRDLFTRPYTAEESLQEGSDTVVNLLEITPVVTTDVTEGQKENSKKEFNTLGKLLSYYAALEPHKLGEISWKCPQIAERIRELADTESMSFRGFFDDALLTKGSGSRAFRFSGVLASPALGLTRGFSIAGTDFGDSIYGGKTTIGSSRGVAAELDPVHFRLIVRD